MIADRSFSVQTISNGELIFKTIRSQKIQLHKIIREGDRDPEEEEAPMKCFLRMEVKLLSLKTGTCGFAISRQEKKPSLPPMV
jgi:hypothetical protein